MLFIIVRFQLWSFIRTQLSILRCRRPVAIFFTLFFFFLFFAAATLKSINTTKKRQEKRKKEPRLHKACLLRRTCVHVKSLLDSWKILVQREYAVYSGGRPSQRYTLSQPDFSLQFSSSFLRYYPTYIIIIGEYTMLSLKIYFI